LNEWSWQRMYTLMYTFNWPILISWHSPQYHNIIKCICCQKYAEYVIFWHTHLQICYKWLSNKCGWTTAKKLFARSTTYVMISWVTISSVILNALRYKYPTANLHLSCGVVIPYNFPIFKGCLHIWVGVHKISTWSNLI